MAASSEYFPQKLPSTHYEPSGGYRLDSDQPLHRVGIIPTYDVNSVPTYEMPIVHKNLTGNTYNALHAMPTNDKAPSPNHAFTFRPTIQTHLEMEQTQPWRGRKIYPQVHKGTFDRMNSQYEGKPYLTTHIYRPAPHIYHPNAHIYHPRNAHQILYERRGRNVESTRKQKRGCCCS